MVLCQDMARGSLGTVREGMKRAKENLSAKEYRDIDNKHRKQLIELKTTEMAASDLDKYHKVIPACEFEILHPIYDPGWWGAVF